MFIKFVREMLIVSVVGVGLMFGATETASDSYLLWTVNQSPVITSTPPVMASPAYHYDVEAIDLDGDVLIFSLSEAPEGMTIEANTGLIAWTATLAQVGAYTPIVTVFDGNGGTASQTLPLTVTSDLFPLTVAFLEGVNLTDRTTEQDETVLSLGVGTDLTGITDILLPDVPMLFTFSDNATFHFEYQNSTAIFGPESTVTQMAIVDTATGGEAFVDITADDLAGLAWQSPAAQPVTATQTMVVQRRDGQVLKIGQVTVDVAAGSVTLFFGDVTP